MSSLTVAENMSTEKQEPGRGLSFSRWLSRRSFRSRITMLVVAAVGLSVAIGALISYISISRAITGRVDDDLRSRAQSILGTALVCVAQSPNGQGMNSTTATNTLNIAGLRGAIVGSDGSQLNPVPYSLDGGPQIDTRIQADSQDVAVADGQIPYSLETIDYHGQLYRVLAVPNTPPSPPGCQVAGDAALVVATPMSSTQSTLNTIETVSIVVGLIGIAMAAAAGFAIGRAALRPVEELSEATEYIARTGDLRSLTVRGDDELAQLTRNFNTMLEALARSQEHQKRLVADAGHELRTPLTSMRTNLDLLAQVMASPDDNRLPAEERVALMNDVRAQMEELSVLIADLVELSRDEQPSHSIERLDLRDVVERASERVQRRAPGVTYDLRLSPWYLDGDPASLERLVTNLMDNAAKFSPEGGTVTVTLADGLLQVADQGPGIAEEDLTHVFERFYRSPEARATPGSGLGLAIVRQIAENHGGRVAAAQAPGGGALLGVWLPGSPISGEAPRDPR